MHYTAVTEVHAATNATSLHTRLMHITQLRV